MRTVTFSDPRVADTVNEHFVSAWHNRSPGFSNMDFTTEQSIFTSSPDAFPTKNICTFVLTPKGRVFSYVAGYLSPERFLEFIDHAIAVRKRVFDDSMNLKKAGLATLRSMHEAQSKRYEKALEEIGNVCEFGDAEYRSLRHRHGKRCGWSAANGLRYLTRLHRQLSGFKSLPALSEVRYKYRYGNNFTEEGGGGMPIANDSAVRNLLV